MNFLKRVLFDQMHPLWRHALLLLPAVMLPSVVIGGVVHTVALLAGIEKTQVDNLAQGRLASAFQSVVFAPLVETVFLSAFIEAARSLKLANLTTAVMAAVMAGGFHAVFDPIWFFQSAWAFFVFACAYLAWRPSSIWEALSIAALTHIFNNAIGTALTLTAGSW